VGISSGVVIRGVAAVLFLIDSFTAGHRGHAAEDGPPS